MLRSITIERFKGFKKLEIKNLASFTLIGGKNDIGKSSFLEAVFLLFDRQNPAVLVAHIGFRGLGSIDAAAAEALWSPAFYDLDTSLPIVITTTDPNGSKDDVRIRVVHDHVSQANFQPFAPGQLPTSLQSQGQAQTALEVLAHKGTKQIQKTYTTASSNGLSLSGQILTQEMRQAVYLFSTRQYDHTTAARLTQVIAAKKLPAIIKTAQIIEPRLTNLEVGAQMNGTVFIMATLDDLPKPIPLALTGGGLGIVVNLALAIACSPNGAVLIDEIETGIHHSALAVVLSALHSLAFANKTQIIATTHSYECIKAASVVFSEIDGNQFRYIRLDRNKEKQVIAKSYPSEDLAFALESEWEVR